ncbi:MAG: class I SAM-dependent methyltransferase [Desulfobaccales bacterium]
MTQSAKLDAALSEPFSLSPEMLRDILYHAKPFGHYENPLNLNLGFGFIYYGVARALRPKHVLVIGSGYGFSVVCLALALKDNGNGRLTFIDPSYSILKDGPFKTVGGRGQWSDAEAVRNHFRRFGVADLVTHYKMRSDEFFPRYDSFSLPAVDLAFIDGSHAYKDVRYDFSQVCERARKNSYIFLHDTNIYIRELLQHAGVKKWLNFLRKNDRAFEVVNFPFSSGVALVRVLEPTAWQRPA